MISITAPLSGDLAHGIRPLPRLRGNYSVAYGINDRGVITGGYKGTGSFLCACAPDGSLSSATLLPLQDAFGINIAGDVVGWHSFHEDVRASLWSKGATLQQLDGELSTALQIKSSVAYAINRAGEVVGGIDTASGMRAFSWTSRQGIRVLPLLPGASASASASINDHGEIVGSMVFGDGKARPCLFDAAGRPQILPLPGGESGHAAHINNRHQIVGEYSLGGGATRAFLGTLQNGTMDLTSLLRPDSGWILTQATCINDAGQIVGKGLHGEHLHAFLLTPTTSPHP